MATLARLASCCSRRLAKLGHTCHEFSTTFKRRLLFACGFKGLKKSHLTKSHSIVQYTDTYTRINNTIVFYTFLHYCLLHIGRFVQGTGFDNSGRLPLKIQTFLDAPLTQCTKPSITVNERHGGIGSDCLAGHALS